MTRLILSPRIRIAFLSALLTSLIGCSSLRIHRDRDAPGHVDLAAEPRFPEQREVEDPRDPGERLLILNSGGYIAGWLSSNDDYKKDQSLPTGGLEFSVLYAERELSHYADDFVLYPQEAWGGSIGWTFFQSGEGLGPLYLEGEYLFYGIFTASGGYAWDPSTNAHGPQVSLSLGPFLFRTLYRAGDRFDFTLGAVFKLPTVWVWSR